MDDAACDPASRPASDYPFSPSMDDSRIKNFRNIFRISIDSFHCHPSQHHSQRGEALSDNTSKRCQAHFDATRNVDCSLYESTRGNGRVHVRVLDARSHHHGEEEEEGCQEGRQDDEEEGPRLSRWLTESLWVSLWFSLWDSLGGAFSTGRSICFATPLPFLFRVQTRKAGPGPWAPGPA
jgi:hypothetical protein